MTINNIITKSKQFASDNQVLVANTIMTLILAVAFISVSKVMAKENDFQTRLIIANNQAYPLAINQPKTEIVSGISYEDINSFNQNPEPEKMKAFIKTVSSDYGVDWKLVYAIGYHESGNFGSSLARSNNNYFGRKAVSGGYASYSTPEDGVRNQCEYIRDKYYARGLTTPQAINPIYAEDSSWQNAVQSLMNTL